MRYLEIIKRTAYILISILWCAQASAADDKSIHTLQFKKWTIDYSCEHRGYQYFTYTVGADNGELERFKPFHHESKLPKHCRQFKTSTYRLPKSVPISYDRGHGVHQNIWDGTKSLMRESNSMANILPQASQLNRKGAWRYTEKLTECFRDKGPVKVWGGVIWGKDSSNDHFKVSHGVTTPDYLWKIIKYPDGMAQGWLFPNSNVATVANIDDYLVSISRLERLSGKKFYLKRTPPKERLAKTRKIPYGCSLK